MPSTTPCSSPSERRSRREQPLRYDPSASSPFDKDSPCRAPSWDEIVYPRGEDEMPPLRNRYESPVSSPFHKFRFPDPYDPFSVRYDQRDCVPAGLRGERRLFAGSPTAAFRGERQKGGTDIMSFLTPQLGSRDVRGSFYGGAVWTGEVRGNKEVRGGDGGCRRVPGWMNETAELHARYEEQLYVLHQGHPHLPHYISPLPTTLFLTTLSLVGSDHTPLPTTLLLPTHYF